VNFYILFDESAKWKAGDLVTNGVYSFIVDYHESGKKWLYIECAEWRFQ